ncbi:MAG: glycoside hydrolase [Bacteroidales bacterium]|nr:glycoside hydrolase [Bacteroidales bacterium]
MNQKLLAIGAALLAMGVLLGTSSCTKGSLGINIPAPKPVDEVIPDDDDSPDGGSDDSGYLCEDIGQTPIVLAYYTENSKELPDPTLLTHINYAHGRFKNPSSGDGGIVIADTGLMQKVIALKARNPRLKVLLMVGGWGMRADGFSMMARDADKRTEFCQSLKEHMDTYGLDGVDIDWEYPTYSAEGTGASAYDTQNFNILLKELRETLGTSKIISFASSASAKYVDWPTAIQYIDYVNVMTYDMGAAPNGHNSPLYRSAKFNHRSCDESIDLHVKAGIPLNRMNLGVPFYGKAEKNVSEANKVYEYEVNYNEMASILNNHWYDKRGIDVTGKNNRAWDDVAKVPFLTDNLGRNLLSYDDPESVGYKGAYVLEKKLLGAMFWEYRHDDSNHSLLKALVNAIYGKESVLE